MVTNRTTRGHAQGDRTPWVIWAAVALHVGWGCLILRNEQTVNITALHDFASRGPSWVWAALFFIVAGLAAAGLTIHRLAVPLGPVPLSSLLLVPQQTMLGLSCMTSGSAILDSAFGDGVVRAREFIAADQYWIFLLTAAYFAAILDGGAVRPKNRELPGRDERA